VLVTLDTSMETGIALIGLAYLVTSLAFLATSGEPRHDTDTALPAPSAAAHGVR